MTSETEFIGQCVNQYMQLNGEKTLGDIVREKRPGITDDKLFDILIEVKNFLVEIRNNTICECQEEELEKRFSE